MKLKIEQRKQLYSAVKGAFQASWDPIARLRRRLLEDMGLRLAEVSTDPSFENVVFSLVAHVESADRAVELGAVALAEQPTNSDAGRFLRSIASTEPDVPPELSFPPADPRSRDVLSDFAQLKPGNALVQDRFIILRLLGGGDVGRVWLAWDRDAVQHCAVKTLRAHLAATPDARERFFEAARLMKSLAHPHAVSIRLERGEHPYPNGQMLCFFVMDYLPRGDLHAFVEALVEARKPLLQAAQQLAEGIGRALDAAHHESPPLTHRRISAPNVLCDAQGTPRLTDIGLIERVDPQCNMKSKRFAEWIFVAPEAHEPSADARADVYSLAVAALFVCSGGKLPFDRRGLGPQLIDRLDATPSLKQVFWKATVCPADQRYRSVAEFLDAWRAATLVEPPGPPAVPVLAPVRGEQRGRGLVIAIAAVLVAGVLSVGAWLGLRGASDTEKPSQPPANASTAAPGANRAPAKTATAPPNPTPSVNVTASATSSGTATRTVPLPPITAVTVKSTTKPATTIPIVGQRR